MSIVQATIKDVAKIQEVVAQSWPDTYGRILSKEQLDYMIKLMYSDAVLLETLAKKDHRFFLFLNDEACIGFAGIEFGYLGQNITRLHKLYLVPQAQGQGVGKSLLAKVIQVAKEEGAECISLNVNRYNHPAIAFYKRMNFVVVGEEDIEIGNGYYMNDFQMELRL